MGRKGENIFHRKDGRWEARYVKGYNLNGTCKYGFIYGKSYQEVKQKRNNILIKYDVRQNNCINMVRFENKIMHWLEKEKLVVKESTYSYYYNVVNKHIRPLLGNVYIENINEQLVINYINKLIETSNLKMSTVREIVIVLKQILNFCNKKVDIKLPKVEKNEVLILTKEDKKILEQYIQCNINEYTIGILLSLNAGLRIGEVCALKWKDINLDTGIISVSKTVSRINNFDSDKNSKTRLIIMEAKTKNSIRQIPINYKLVHLLKKFKGSKDDDFYILSSNNKFVDPRNYCYKYKHILNKCNISNYKYHALRHTFATNCIELGLDPKSLSEILGHSDIKITLSLYVHPSLEVKKNFMNTKFICQTNF